MNESATILVAAISVVAIISLFSSKMGVFGETISAVLKGLLGLGGYLLPFVVIIFSIWIFMSEKREGFKLKIAASALFLCSIAAFAFALSSDGQGRISVQRLYDTGGALNGGVIGGVFGNFLISFFGKMGKEMNADLQKEKKRNTELPSVRKRRKNVVRYLIYLWMRTTLTIMTVGIMTTELNMMRKNRRNSRKESFLRIIL